MDDYLAHYGVQGQKWGIRRFQNPDGSLTAEGKARARKEYKADNKEAFENGRDATILSRASSISKRKYEKAIERYQKNPTEKNAVKKLVAGFTYGELDHKSKKAQEKAEKHAKTLIKKYGKEAVSSIHYDKKGRVTEQVASKEEIIASFALTFGSVGATALLKTPFYILSMPTGAEQRGYGEYVRTKAKYQKMIKSHS